jgi:multiple sugar transport system substrate-binding protein
MKKVLLVVLCLVLVVLPLSACGSSSAPAEPSQTTAQGDESAGTTAGEPEKTASLAGSKITMSVLSGGYMPAIKPSVDKFIQESGINVELVGLEEAALREKTLIEVNSGADTFDIYSIDGPPYVYEVQGALERLQPYVDRDNIDLSKFLDVYLEMSRYPSEFTPHDANYKRGDGELVSLPVRIGVHILHYRKDLFDAAGLTPPNSMEELYQAAKKLTGSKTPEGEKVYGLILQGDQSTWGFIQYMDFLWSYGGEMLTPDMKQSALNSPEALKALEMMVRLYKDGYTPPATPTYDMDTAVAALQQGIGAMYLEYSPRALVINNPEKSKTAGKWAWSVIPSDKGGTGSGCVTGWSMGINNKSKNKDAAWELIKYLTSEETQTRMAIENANGPVLTSVFENAEYQKAFPAALAVLEAAKNGKVRPGVYQIAQIEDLISKAVNSSLLGTTTPAKALATAHEGINAILAEAD